MALASLGVWDNNIPEFRDAASNFIGYLKITVDVLGQFWGESKGARFIAQCHDQIVERIILLGQLYGLWIVSIKNELQSAVFTYINHACPKIYRALMHFQKRDASYLRDRRADTKFDYHGSHAVACII